jgi:hypothetical protein
VTAQAAGIAFIGAETLRQQDPMRRRAYHESGHAVAAITFAIPIISVSIDAAMPHLQRGRYRPPHDAGLESLVVMCLCGPEAERMAFGAIEDGTDATDLAMARRYLAKRLEPVQLAAEMMRLRGSAERLVRTVWARARIEVIADALLARGTLTGEEICAVGTAMPERRGAAIPSMI